MKCRVPLGTEYAFVLLDVIQAYIYSLKRGFFIFKAQNKKEIKATQVLSMNATAKSE